jgi:hypothetical protein
MFPQVCFLWETHEKDEKKTEKQKRGVWYLSCRMALLLILTNLLPFPSSFICVITQFWVIPQNSFFFPKKIKKIKNKK